MSTIVLIAAGKRFAIPTALKPTPSAPQNRPLQQLGGNYL